MKLTKNNKLESILLGILILHFFSLGFSRVASTIPAILIIFFGLIYIVKSQNTNLKKIFLENTFVRITSYYFILCLFSFFQEEIFLEFFDKIKLKVFFLIIPIVLFGLSEIILKYKNKLNKAIIIGSYSSIILFLIVATTKFNIIGAQAFTYSELFSIGYINPIMYSLYTNLSILILYYHTPNLNKLLKHILILISGVIIFLGLSKFGIFIFILSYLFILILEIKENMLNGIKTFAIVMLLIGSTTYILSSNQMISKRFGQFQSQIIHFENKNYKNSFPRLNVFKSASKLIKENMFIGIGISNIKERLLEEYKKDNFRKGIAYKLDAHNQFIQTFLGSGIVGFLILFYLFFYLIYTSFKIKSLLLFHASIIILLFSLIESIFESQMGVFIFLLFIPYILILEKKRKLKL